MKDYFLAVICPRATMNTIRTGHAGCKPHDFIPRYDIILFAIPKRYSKRCILRLWFNFLETPLLTIILSNMSISSSNNIQSGSHIGKTNISRKLVSGLMSGTPRVSLLSERAESSCRTCVSVR